MLLGYGVYLLFTVLRGIVWWWQGRFGDHFGFFLLIWAVVTIPPAVAAVALTFPSYSAGVWQTRTQRVIVFNVVALVILALWTWAAFGSSFDGI